MSIAFWSAAVFALVGFLVYRQGQLGLVGLHVGGSVTGHASVVSGDTLQVNGQRIRLASIDAPELEQNCKKDGEPWPCGRAAANALEDFLGNRTVTCLERGRDRERRMVALCEADGEDVAAWLVLNGWALAYARYSDGSYSARQRRAEREKRGLWQGEFDPPWDWRRLGRPSP